MEHSKAPEAQPSTPRPNILVVEYDDQQREALTESFAPYGNIKPTSVAAEAYQAFIQAHGEQSPFDLIVLSLQIPEGSAIDLLQKTRSWELNYNVHRIGRQSKVIVIASEPHSPEILPAFRNGAHACICCALDPQAVKEALQRCEFLDSPQASSSENPTEATCAL